MVRTPSEPSRVAPGGADPRSSGSPRTKAPRRAGPTGRSLPALLDVALDELLGVLLEHGVDLIEDVVHLFLQVGGLGRVAHLAGVGVCLTCAAALALGAFLLLLLRHRRSPRAGSPILRELRLERPKNEDGPRA